MLRTKDGAEVDRGDIVYYVDRNGTMNVCIAGACEGGPAKAGWYSSQKAAKLRLERVTTTPPCHNACAVYGATEMPDLVMGRDATLCVVWTTRSFVFGVGDPTGVVFGVGDPTGVQWFREGWPATRAQVLESIRAGLPTLRASAGELDVAEGSAAASHALGQAVAAAMCLVASTTEGEAAEAASG